MDLNLRVVYGLLIGGPSDGWGGISNSLFDCKEHVRIGWDENFKLPDLPWVRADVAVTEENHPDHFYSILDAKLDESVGIRNEVKVELFGSCETGKWWYALSALRLEDEEPTSMLSIPKKRPEELAELDGMLFTAFDLLGLEARELNKPSWICGIVDD